METKVQTVSNLGSITTIPTRCFKNCKQLTEINLPSTCTTIETGAFNGCENLQIINLQNITTLLGTFADEQFRNTSLVKLGGPNSNNYEIYMPNLTGSINGLRGLGTTNAYNITSLGTITTVDYWGFASTKIGSITLPDTLTTINGGAFRDTNTQIVNWQGTMDQWVNIDFADEYSSPLTEGVGELRINGVAPTSYLFPSNTTTIKKWCLKNIKTLTSVTIPSLVSLGQYAFYGTKVATVTSLGSTITSIPSGCFKGCTMLSSVNIPNTVTSIEYEAFMECSSLTSITIPSGVTYIGNRAFMSSGIVDMTVLATTPPTLGASPIQASGHIYVPAESVSAYQAAWSDFASIIQAIPNT